MRARGFTLVEVMVALAVVAIALPALLTALYQQMDDTGYLRDKSLAHMVAANKLEELRIVINATRQLGAGKDSGQVQMADRDWYWRLETKPTEVAQYFRVEIRVAAEEDERTQPLYTLIAFMSSDLEIDLNAPAQGPGQGQDPLPDQGSGPGEGQESIPGQGQDFGQDPGSTPEIPGFTPDPETGIIRGGS